MTDLFTIRDFGGRTYVPVQLLDADGRPAQLRTPGPVPGDYREVVPWICGDCFVVTVDPVGHNELHDGPSCRVCGCTDDNACTGGCWWVDDGLCSSCAGPAEPDPAVVDLVAALRVSVEAARARREGGGRP